jgi:hypothetical protein
MQMPNMPPGGGAGMPGGAPGQAPGGPSGAPGAGGPAGVLSALMGAMKPPAPTHGLTVAALRHFDSTIGILKSVLADLAVGKSSVKSKIIDGVTKLVSERMLSASEAVNQLATVPPEPFQQRKWLENHLQSAMTARSTVLDHHGQSHGGVPEGQIDAKSNPDDHMNDMMGLRGHYQNGGPNG